MWIPNTECGERCKMNPPEKNTVAFCSNEKCFCHKEYIVPGNVSVAGNATAKSFKIKMKGNFYLVYGMIFVVIFLVKNGY